MHPYSTTQLPKSSPHPPCLPQVTFLSSLPFQSDPSVSSPWNCCLFWSQCIIPERLWGFRVKCEWVMLADEWREEDRIGWRDRWEMAWGLVVYYRRKGEGQKIFLWGYHEAKKACQEPWLQGWSFHQPWTPREKSMKWTWSHFSDKDFFFNLFIFNWRIIALQCCVGFCHTSTWISHRYTYIPSLLKLPSNSHLPPHLTPLGCHRAPDWAPCIIQQIPTGCLFYMW